MPEVTFPLRLRMTGDAVATLREALPALGLTIIEAEQSARPATYRVSGRVLRADGTPVADARVKFFRQGLPHGASLDERAGAGLPRRGPKSPGDRTVTFKEGANTGAAPSVVSAANGRHRLNPNDVRALLIVFRCTVS